MEKINVSNSAFRQGGQLFVCPHSNFTTLWRKLLNFVYITTWCVDMQDLFFITGKKIVLEPTYTYIYKQGIQLQYERYT